MAKKRKNPLKRGPKGGKKHTPGRDHDRKSRKGKDAKRQKRARKRRDALADLARQQWRVWDSLSSEQKKMRDELRPSLPRPTDEQA